MSDVPDFAGPRTLVSREAMVRPGTGNERHSQSGMVVSYGLDDNMIVEFYEEPLHMEYLSKQVGHPIFRMQIMTRIIQPGNRNTVWTHQTKGITYEMVIDPESGEYHTNWDLQEVCDNGDPPEPVKYPNAWKRFMRKGTSADVGLPIEQWAVVSRSYAESLKAQHIHTVEALAGLTDQAAQNIMGAIKYRDLARAHLDDRARSQIVAREQEKATRAEEQNQHLAKQVEALQQHVLALQAKLAGSDLPMPVHGQNRMVTETAPIAGELKKMSKANAQKKHRIPDEAA